MGYHFPRPFSRERVGGGEGAAFPPWPGSSRPSTRLRLRPIGTVPRLDDVDDRDKPGHDGVWAHAIRLGGWFFTGSAVSSVVPSIGRRPRSPHPDRAFRPSAISRRGSLHRRGAAFATGCEAWPPSSATLYPNRATSIAAAQALQDQLAIGQNSHRGHHEAKWPSGSNIEMSIAALHEAAHQTPRVHPKRNASRSASAPKTRSGRLSWHLLRHRCLYGDACHTEREQAGGCRRKVDPSPAPAPPIRRPSEPLRTPSIFLRSRPRTAQSIAPGGVQTREPDVMDLGDDQRRHHREQHQRPPRGESRERIQRSGCARRGSAQPRNERGYPARPPARPMRGR